MQTHPTPSTDGPARKHRSTGAALHGGCRLALCLLLTVCVMGSRAQDPAPVAPVDPLAAIHAAIDDELFDLAFDRLNRYLETLPRDAPDYRDGLILWARTAHALGRHAAIIKRFEPLWDPENDDETEIGVWLAIAYHHHNRQDAAASMAERLIDRHPDSPHHPEMMRLRATALAAASRDGEAIAAFAAFDAAYPDHPEADANRLAWAHLLLATRQYDKATAILQGLAMDPATRAGYDAAYRLGRLALEADRLDDAETRFTAIQEASAEKSATDGHLHLAMAELRERQGDLPAALDHLEQAISALSQGDRRRQAEIDATRLLFETGQAELGATRLRKIIHAAPQRDDVPQLQLSLGNGLLRHTHYERAAAEFQTYLEAFTNRLGQAQALSGLGWAFIGLERHIEAAEHFEHAARLFDDPPRRVDALIKAADAWFLQERFTVALERYQQAADAADAIADADRFAQARYQAAICLIRLEQPDDAFALLQALAERLPDHAIAEKALLRKAKLHEQRGALSQALQAYDQLRERDPAAAVLADALLSSGMLRYQMFRFDEALATFTALIDQLPEHPFVEQARFMHIWSHSMTGNETQAIKAAHVFLEHHPDSTRVPEVLFRIAEHEFNHDRLDEAKRQFIALADAHPDSRVADNALLWAGRSAARQREFRAAIDLFTRLANDYPDSPRLAEARFAKADAFSELGEFAEAILLFDDVINRFPDSYLQPAAWGRKGDSQFILGSADSQRYVEAIASYRAVLDASAAAPDMQLQALYKIGRCHDHLDNHDLALDHFHQVLVRFETMLKQGIRPTPAAVWGFQRAAFDAAAILEAREQWRQVVHLLQRLVDAGTPGAGQARERIEQLRNEYWLLYY